MRKVGKLLFANTLHSTEKTTITHQGNGQVSCIVGWVNLYQKYTVCGKLILPKNMERHFFIFFWHNWLANMHGFANICKLPVSNNFKDMQ